MKKKWDKKIYNNALWYLLLINSELLKKILSDNELLIDERFFLYQVCQARVYRWSYIQSLHLAYYSQMCYEYFFG